MAVTSTTSRIQYSGDDSTTAFAIPFYFLEDGDLKVILTSVAGVDTVQTITTHYTVTGAGETSGGTLTMVTPPATDEELTILRNVAITQSVDYVENDSFPADTHEQALDRLTMIAQQLNEAQDRSIALSEGSAISTPDFPEPIANYYIRWDSAGTALEAVATSPGSGIGAVSDDTSPQLGGDLDANAFDVQFDDATGIRDDSDNEQLIFQKTTSAVNYLEITNAAAATSPSLSAAGTDTNVGITIDGKGTGTIAIGSADSVVTLDGTSISGTMIKDEDDMLSDSATHLASQQSIKAYVDTLGSQTAATQAQQETATSTSTYVSPGRQQYHPSAAKMWVKWDASSGTPTIDVSYNVTSLTDNAVGDVSIVIATDFSSTEYACASMAERGEISGTQILNISSAATPTSGTIRVTTSDGGTNLDDDQNSVIAFGDQ